MINWLKYLPIQYIHSNLNLNSKILKVINAFEFVLSLFCSCFEIKSQIFIFLKRFLLSSHLFDARKKLNGLHLEKMSQGWSLNLELTHRNDFNSRCYMNTSQIYEVGISVGCYLFSWWSSHSARRQLKSQVSAHFALNLSFESHLQR